MDRRTETRPSRSISARLAGRRPQAALAAGVALSAAVATMAGAPAVAAGHPTPAAHPAQRHAAPTTLRAALQALARPAPKAPQRHVVASNLDVPWGIAFIPGGGILLGGRDTARITLVHKNGTKKVVRRMHGVVPNGHEGGEAGLLGLTLAPDFSKSRWVYAYFSSGHDNRIVRMKWQHRHLGAQHLIFKGIPTSLHHNGGRIAFGPDGMLYATTGEAEVPSRAQNRHSLGGKILRMTPRGKPAPGNPFPHSVVYSYGHRNVEGLAWDPQGRLWATEFGDHTWDELNLIQPGHNYGWPIVEGRSSDSRFTNPKTVWHTDQAGPSGIAITRVHGKTVAFIGAVTGHRLWRVVLKGDRVVGRRALYTDQLGRIRTTAVHDGYVYFTTSNTDGRATPHPNDDKLLRFKLG